MTAAAAMSDLLRAAWPRHASKRAASAAGTSYSVAQHWIAGRRTPSADTLLRMLRHSAELRATLIRELREAGHADMAEAAACGDVPPGRAAAQPAGGPAGPAVTWNGAERRRGERRRG